MSRAELAASPIFWFCYVGLVLLLTYITARAIYWWDWFGKRRTLALDVEWVDENEDEEHK